MMSTQPPTSAEHVALLVEDDVVLSRMWHDRVTSSLRDVPDDWDVLRFAHWFDF